MPVPAGPFAFGDDPARLFSPDDDESPRRVVRVEGFLISRVPVVNSDGLPLTYVSRDEAETFCAANGVRLPTELEWEAAARGGDDRLWPWGDELPDATRATFAQGIGGPSRAGLHPAGAAPCGALDLAGNVWEWTADGAARGGSYLSGPGELRCSARFPVHPAARDPYVGFRVVAVEPTRSFDWVEVPSGDYVIGRDLGETRQRLVEVDGFELTRTPVTNEQYERFVAEAGAAAPPHWPARTSICPTIPSPSSTGTRRPRSVPGQRPAAQRARVGEGSPRHRRARVPVGRRGRRGPRHGRGRDEARRDVTRRLPSGRGQSVRPAGHGRKRLGVDVRRSTRPANAFSAAARSRARGSPGPGARCAATADRCEGRRTSDFGSRG